MLYDSKGLKYKSLVCVGRAVCAVMRKDSQQMAMLYSCSSRRQPHQQGREASDSPYTPQEENA